MQAEEAAITPDTAVVTDLFSALLHVDPRLGHDEDDFRRVRKHPDVRRAIAGRLAKPTIRRHQLTIDYDAPTSPLFDTTECQSINPALTVRSFPVDRFGLETIEIVEIFPDRILSTLQQLHLAEVLGCRQPNHIEARKILNTILRKARYPIMALCGPLFLLRPQQDAIPGIFQNESGRMLVACRLTDFLSQECRILAVAMS